MTSRPSFILLFLIPGLVLLAIISFLTFRKPQSELIMDTHFAPAQIISAENDGPKRVFVADVDGDGHMDVLAISLFDNKLTWYENTDGHGAFGPQRIISTEFLGGDSVHAADMDRDGDLDVLSASSGDGKIVWYENMDGVGTFGPQQVINPQAPMAYFVVAADFDQDQDLDVLYDMWDLNAIAWQENLDGQGTFGAANVISSNVEGASSVFAADLDNDGDMDALATAANSNRLTWHENTDGQGTFGEPIVISTDLRLPYAVFAADLDQDGDLDVLSASSEDSKIAWYENLDGQGTFGLQWAIDTKATQASAVYAADLDEDGDQDVLMTAAGDNTLAWYENDGAGHFGKRQVITDQALGASSVVAADLDRDGDQDLVVAALDGDQILWFKNLTPLSFYFPFIAYPEE